MKWYIIKKLVPSSRDLMRMQIKYIVTDGKQSRRFDQLDIAVVFWSQLMAEIPMDEIDLDSEAEEDRGTI